MSIQFSALESAHMSADRNGWQREVNDALMNYLEADDLDFAADELERR